MSELERANRHTPDKRMVHRSNQHVVEQFREIMKEVSDAIAPVWPLRDYVAVNPYFGIRHRRFMDARAFLRVFSHCEMVMPWNYYVQEYHRGAFHLGDLMQAIEEVDETGLNVPLTARELVNLLETTPPFSHSGWDGTVAENPSRWIQTMAEMAAERSAFDWVELVRDEISKWCSAHYDQGQSTWASPYQDLPLYQAWRHLASLDRNMEAMGVVGFRDMVRLLPFTAEAAIVHLLQRLNIPLPLWSTFLLAQAYSVQGWAAWTRYQDSECESPTSNDLAGLLAIRLAYDVAVSESLGLFQCWDEFVREDTATFPMPAAHQEAVLRFVFLRASEINYRNSLLGSLEQRPVATRKPVRKLAQMVFCIDVRSERYRRQLEAIHGDIETFGFAGFFGIPMAYSEWGQASALPQLPVLLRPQFVVKQDLPSGAGPNATARHEEMRHLQQTLSDTKTWQSMWGAFQTSASGCFSFVETTGWSDGWKLMKRLWRGFSGAMGLTGDKHSHCRPGVGPSRLGLRAQGVELERQVAMAEGLLINLGLRSAFGKLVVFCGHTSQTDNNPLAASLDCGACGGHSGEPNARFAALLLNQSEVRTGLSARGIAIPDDTYFLAALHNTTTDAITLFDDAIPESHSEAVSQLRESLWLASEQTRWERLPSLLAKRGQDCFRRACDWSEVRPEWGLAGNAAFVIGPRWMTRGVELDSRSFLHTYDASLDGDGRVLEQIMTAPMIVANWINMQYYASTVDPAHFGSGSKTIHNVVGRFGILSGNGGDLQTGMPWQSVHNGEGYQHTPLRLQVVIAAPRTRVDSIIQRHETVANLVTNGWLHLVVVESDEKCYRYSTQGQWIELS